MKFKEMLMAEKTGDKKEYQAFFRKTLKKYNVKSADELSVEDKKKFYNEIDAGWKSDAEEAGIDESADSKYKNLVRYIPSGSKVISELGDKSLKITIQSPRSAPPLVTKDVSRIERTMLSDVDSFVGDVEKEIKLKNVSKETYVFMSTTPKSIIFTYSFILEVGSKVEGKKLKMLDDALDFYKKFKIN